MVLLLKVTTQLMLSSSFLCFILTLISTCRALSIINNLERTSTASISKLEESLRLSQKLHEEECNNGFQKFGRYSPSLPTKDVILWSNDDFDSHSVGKKNSGPDESALLYNSDVIFQTKHPIVSKNECEALIHEARKAITDGLRHDGEVRDITKTNKDDNRKNPTNSELGEAKVSTLPMAREWLKENLQSTFSPLLQNRFGVKAENLTLHDALIIGYGYFGSGCRSQPVHRDSSLLSLNLALSPQSNYTGGGTYFEALGKKLHQDQGHITCHAGGAFHAGTGIDSGERWVLVLFVLDESKPQLARRCHSLGLNAHRQSKIEDAKTHFKASLTINPKNHLVYKDLGRSYSMKQNEISQSRRCLAMTTKLYPLDGQAFLGLANMLVHAKRPRAALRRLDSLFATTALADGIFFEKEEENIWPPLKSLGWEARVLAAQCALQCASRQPHAKVLSVLLPIAIQRIETCLKVSPSPYLESMLEAAQGMMMGR